MKKQTNKQRKNFVSYYSAEFMNDVIAYHLSDTYEKVWNDNVIKSGQPLTLSTHHRVLIGFLGTRTLLP